MECLSCRYELSGLPAGNCPECGRSFDPKDRTTVGPEIESRVGPWKVVLAIAAFGWPMVMTLLALGCQLVARMVLGRWPNTSGADDPKAIPVVGSLYIAWLVSVLLTVPIVAAGLVGIGWIAARRWRLGLLSFFAGVACWFLAIALNRLTEVGTWMMD